jgi:outer membrane protein
MRAHLAAVALAAVALSLPGPAHAQQPWPGEPVRPWKARLRLVGVFPNDSSGTIGATGSQFTVGSATGPDLEVSYQVTPHWGVAFSLSAWECTLATTGGAAGGLDAGSAWVVPVTASLLYHFSSYARLDPYLGVGLSFASFNGYQLSGPLLQFVKSIEFSDSLRLASQLGLNLRLSPRWSANLDLKYVPISTQLTIERATGGTLGNVRLDLNPWVAGIGAGFAF